MFLYSRLFILSQLTTTLGWATNYTLSLTTINYYTLFIYINILLIVFDVGDV